MARTMINEKGLSKSFWTEAIHKAAYILNGIPIEALKDKIHVEALRGMKPSVTHFKFSVVFVILMYLLRKEKNWMKKSKIYRSWL